MDVRFVVIKPKARPPIGDYSATGLRHLPICAAEGRTIGEAMPEPVGQIERALDRVAREVVWKAVVVSPPGSASNHAPLSTVGDPHRPPLSVHRLLKADLHLTTFALSRDSGQLISGSAWNRPHVL
jgi:hypothetical protein